MKKFSITTLLLICIAIVMGSCAHTTMGGLVGADRDEHGCIGSAGYTWSYALHSCVRVWEAGTAFDAGPDRIFVIFSPDSAMAEIFAKKEKSIICRRVKDTNTWQPKKGKESVSIQNGVIRVKVDDFTYTKEQ